MQCKDCRFWECFSQTDNRPHQIPLSEESKWGLCLKIDLEIGSLSTEAIAFTKDASDYSASLNTKENFGCVLFEAK